MSIPRAPRWGRVALALLAGLAACAAFALPLPAQQATPQVADAPQRSWDEYRETIVIGNIFSRQSGQRRQAEQEAGRIAERREARPPQPEPAPIDPADLFVLRGVTHVGDVAHAFFENLDAGGIHAIVIGQTVAQRRVTAITLDSVQLSLLEPPAAGQRDFEPLIQGDYEIQIGWALSGSQFPAATPQRRPTPQPSSAASATQAASDEAEVDEQELSVEERLRRRRQQQLNQ